MLNSTHQTATLHAPRGAGGAGGSFGRALKGMDGFLLGCVGLLLALGLLFIARTLAGAAPATHGAGLWARQALYLGLGLVLFIALQQVDYLALLRWAPAFYLGGLMLLGAVLFTRPVHGARSWFDLYLFKLQPSELMKPILILTLAHYLMYRESYKRLGGLLVPLALCLFPMALILRQPDLGTTMVLVPVCFAIIYAAGARLRHLFLTILLGAAGLVEMWFTVMKDYQKRRILAWLNPREYRLGEAWQLLQAEVAVGSGGFWGLGTGPAGKGGRLNLLPERHTDFIFAVIAEQGGFATAGLLLLLFVLVTLCGLGIASRTREPAGRLIAVGVSVLLASQALVNAGVALGMLPTTGLTLPFVSYGGSSLISSFICLGLLVNVGSRREVYLARDTFS